MVATKFIAGLCAMIPVAGLAVYLGYFADFSHELAPLSPAEFSKVGGCYYWRDYMIKAKNSSLELYHGNDMVAQTPATYQQSRDIRVMSDIRFELNPGDMTIAAVHAPATQTYIYTSRLFSEPYFTVFVPAPPNDKSVEFEKSACQAISPEASSPSSPQSRSS
jgi:hypothetical protein